LLTSKVITIYVPAATSHPDTTNKETERQKEAGLTLKYNLKSSRSVCHSSQNCKMKVNRYLCYKVEQNGVWVIYIPLFAFDLSHHWHWLKGNHLYHFRDLQSKTSKNSETKPNKSAIMHGYLFWKRCYREINFANL
jgi:hypothetical protein